MLIDVQPGDYVYPNARCIGVYDGDTCYLDIDLGRYLHWSDRNREGQPKRGNRLLDIDAPEIRPLVTRQAGTEARDYLASLIVGVPLLVWSVDNPEHRPDDNFGRYLVWLRVHDGTLGGLDVNRAMLDSGHAVPFQP